MGPLRGLGLATLVLGVSITSGKHIPMAIAGPFRIVPDQLLQCPPSMMPPRKLYEYEYTTSRDRSRPDVWYVSANVSTFTTVDDNITGTLSVESWGSRGGWVPNAFNFRIQKPCVFAQTHFKQYWKRFMILLFKDANRRCPFPPSNVSVVDFATDMDITMPPAFYYGKYRSTAMAFNSKTNEILACGRATCWVKPKQPKTS